MFIAGDTLTIPELDYLLVGEKFNEGNRLYSEIWTRLGPLSSIFYGVMNFVFGRSQLALQILALLVVFFQSLIFNKILLIHKAFDESTYVPALIYALLMSWFFDQFSLSPALLGLTFILLALNNVLAHLEFKAKKDEIILNIGIHIGVATLFYLPYAIAVPFVLISFAFFSSTIVRRYLLMVYGFLLPVLLTAMIFLLTGRLNEFVIQFLLPDFGQKEIFIDWLHQLIIFGLPLLFFILGLLAVVQRVRFTVFQANLSKFMMIWVLFDIAYMFAVRNVVPANLAIFVPPVTYYISQYFLNIRRKWIAEILFTLFVFGAVLFNHGTLYNFFPTSDLIDISRYRIVSGDYDERVASRKILVLGSDIRPYASARSATPFLEWSLAGEVFQNPGYYDNLSVIGAGLKHDMPEMIVDQSKLMPVLKEYIPALKAYNSSDGIYYRKED